MTSKNHLTPDKIFSKRDVLQLLDVIHASLSCMTETGFRDLMRDVKT